MKRRLNYTERKKLTRDMTELNLTRQQGIVTSFAASVKLDGLALPDTAKVYVEAYHRTEFLRYSLKKQLRNLQQSSLNLRTMVASKSGTKSFSTGDAAVVRIPRV